VCTILSELCFLWVTGKVDFSRVARHNSNHRFYNTCGVCSIICTFSACSMRSIICPQWVTGKLTFLPIAENTFRCRFYNPTCQSQSLTNRRIKQQELYTKYITLLFAGKSIYCDMITALGSHNTRSAQVMINQTPTTYYTTIGRNPIPFIILLSIIGL